METRTSGNNIGKQKESERELSITVSAEMWTLHGIGLIYAIVTTTPSVSLGKQESCQTTFTPTMSMSQQTTTHTHTHMGDKK